MTKKEIIRNLKYTMEKHKNDRVDTFGTNISLMCKDILDYLEQEPCVDCISRQAVIDAVKDAVIKDEQQYAEDALKALPSAQPEWNNHTVACMLAELFDDTCACNYNGIDEWLPSKCELLDSCPNPVGVACWEQFLKHKAKRRSDE